MTHSYDYVTIYAIPIVDYVYLVFCRGRSRLRKYITTISTTGESRVLITHLFV